MRILCVIDNLGSGGAQRQLVNIAVGLKSRGHDVQFFTYFPDEFFKPFLDKASIPVYLSKKKSRFSLKPAFDLRKVVRKQSLDAVLAFLETPSIYAELACIGHQKVRLIVSERNLSPDGKITFTKTIKAILHIFADAVTTNSHAQRFWIQKSFPWLKKKVATIINGVDLQNFAPLLRRPSSTSNQCLRLLGLGRITRQKNIPRLIEALGVCVYQKQIDVRIDWAGRQDSYDEFALAKNALQTNRVEERWRWLGEVDNVAQLLQNYDALILPSLWEGLPNAVCEALACGLPVLASNVSDNALLIQHGISGFLFDPLNINEIASSIDALNNLDIVSRNKMSKAARIYAEENLSFAKLTLGYELIVLHENS
jgi:glycosyltransferase involved in cell wall biosynthesis